MGPGALILLGLAKIAAVVTVIKVGKKPKCVDKRAEKAKKHKSK